MKHHLTCQNQSVCNFSFYTKSYRDCKVEISSRSIDSICRFRISGIKIQIIMPKACNTSENIRCNGAIKQIFDFVAKEMPFNSCGHISNIGTERKLTIAFSWYIRLCIITAEGCFSYLHTSRHTFVEVPFKQSTKSKLVRVHIVSATNISNRVASS